MSRQSASPPPDQGDSKRRTRRRKLLAALLVLLIVPCLAIVAFVAMPSSGVNAELTDTQWNNLIRRMRESAEGADAEPEKYGDAPADASDTVTPGPSDTAAAPEQAAPPDPALPVEAPPVEQLPVAARERQVAQYQAAASKSVIELQPFRTELSIPVEDGGGHRGNATLINLQPTINSWYLLRLSWDGEPALTFHLANNEPGRRALRLDAAFPRGISLTDSRSSTPCDLWTQDNPQRLDVAAARSSPYVLLCDGHVTLRLRTSGYRTRVERVTDFLRDNIWGGEALTVFVRQTLYQDRYLSTGELGTRADSRSGAGSSPTMPRPARVAPEAEGRRVEGSDLGLSIDTGDNRPPVLGSWYPVRDNPGVFASTMQPGLVAPDILASHADLVVRLDEVESSALAYLAAFDLAQFELAFSLGTDHPRLGWSERVPEERRDPTLPGPDGIDSTEPLIATGIIAAALAPRAVATFTGGFKRTHGSFRYGDLAMVNNGSHYGFIEEGVVFSKLQPGLSTILVLDDGSVDMKTWTPADDARLPGIRYARQNGVPILERAAPGGVPGALISRYGAGNWSGSQDGNYRTLRAGACLQETEQRRFLIYAYFSSATPSAMARLFQAYGCTYAMLLDMNALEHTYMAVYSLRNADLTVEHLVNGMEVLDKVDGDHLLPRFLGYADNRDFFYVLRRDAAAPPPPESGR